MKLLIVTQTVDETDPVLGFMCTWLTEFSKKFERIEVICLNEGQHSLPENVRVHSLGKEKGRASRGRYALRFLSYVWKLRGSYDAVFVHMNQEYILIAGVLWKLLGKKIYLWRNHYAGSWMTDIAVAFCTKVFCTSTHSYTAHYKKTVLMPVGVDTARFARGETSTRVPHSILFLARMAPSKRPEILIDALALLTRKGVSFTASFVGSPLPQDEAFYASVKKRTEEAGIAAHVSFLSGVPKERAAELFRTHQLFVNTSPPGMYDKTIFEAAASGCVVLANNEDWRALAGDAFYFAGTPQALAERLSSHLSMQTQAKTTQALEAIVERQSLARLTNELVKELGD